MACNVCSPQNVDCNTVYPTLSPCLCNDTPAIREEGPPGGAATITVGTVTTLPSGEDATVVNVGTASAAIFNFAIPEGPVGPAPSFDVPIHMTSTLTVDGLTTLGGGLDTVDIDATGNVTIGGTLGVTEAVNTGALTVTGNGTITGGLGVTGSITSGGIVGVVNGSNATSGDVGQYIESIVPGGSAVSVTVNTPTNVTSISLPAGDWDVSGNAAINLAASTSLTEYGGGISISSGSFGSDAETFINRMAATVFGAANLIGTLPTVRLSLASTTTVYLLVLCEFTVSTVTAYGALHARRVR